MPRYWLFLQTIELNGAPYWFPVTQEADSPEEAIDRVLESSTGELTNGARYREITVVPFDDVKTFQIERQPRPYFRRMEAQ